MQPRLHSPLLPIPALPDAATTLLVTLRSVLAVLLLLGLRTRASALLLFSVGYWLMASDRYRYLHHTHLLWLSCLWLALVEAPKGWSLERLFAVGAPPRQLARWSLSLLRAQGLVVYAAAGAAKLNAAWLSGRSLTLLLGADALGGPLVTFALPLLGVRGLALAALLTELLLVVLLSVRRLRMAGVLLGLSFHALLSASMVVSTFSAQMALYLMLFLPWDKPEAPSDSGVAAATAGDSIPVATGQESAN